MKKKLKANHRLSYFLWSISMSLLSWSALADPPSTAYQPGPETGRVSNAECDRLENEAQQGATDCGGTRYYCSNSSNWNAHPVYLQSVTAVENDFVNARNCRNQASAYCCNQSAFLRAVGRRCEWIDHSLFTSFLGFHPGTSFLHECDSVRILVFHGERLWLGSENSPVATTIPRLPDSIQPAPREHADSHPPHTHEELPNELVQQNAPPAPPPGAAR